MFRHGTNVVKGYRTQDGAGVSLVRVLGAETAAAFGPFLMLDSFDSTDPDAYTAGFPLHPHRGIETVTYLAEGAIQHRDTMGVFRHDSRRRGAVDVRRLGHRAR